MNFYIHHYYTYELFWYFFHGVQITEPIPSWFSENRYNKKSKILNEIIVKCKYKGNDINVIFSKEGNWDKDDGYHIIDYYIKLIEENHITDRGWNGDIPNDMLPETIDFLSKKIDKKILFFYINWEPFMETEKNQMNRLSKNTLFFVDDNSIKYSKNQKYSNTHILASYIFPDTLGIRDFYFFADFLKYKNDFKYRLNFAIRRIHIHKTEIAKKLKKLKNKHISVSLSSFTDYAQHEVNFEKLKYDLNEDIKNINDLYIQKRGYNVNDWGGEWNSNNMNEFLWKMFGISEINLIYETWQNTHINEKSIIHILAGKPFIPCRYNTINYYDNLCKKYNLNVEKFPIQYEYILNNLDELNDIIMNDSKYEKFLYNLKRYVNNMRDNFIKIIHNNNDMLDIIINKDDNKSTSLI